MFLFRIRRRSDGKFYGTGTRFGRDHWKKTGKFLTLPALRAILRGSGLRDIDVLRYLVDEDKYEVLDKEQIT